MEIKVYLHRTKKKEFAVCDCFSVFVDLDKLPEEKKEDVDFINLGFKNDCQRIARTRDVVKKYGIAYLSFMVPKFEGDEKDNGNDKVYFDNEQMLFMKRPVKKTRKKKTTEESNNEEK